MFWFFAGILTAVGFIIVAGKGGNKNILSEG
jgi:hypothetical protein